MSIVTRVPSMFTTAAVFMLLSLVFVAPSFADEIELPDSADDVELIADAVEQDIATPAATLAAPSIDTDSNKAPSLEQDSDISYAGACGSYIYSQPCQTGGWYTVFCEACPGKQCYHRWEGTLYNYSGGTKASGFHMTTRCSAPPSMATCNTTCS